MKKIFSALLLLFSLCASTVVAKHYTVVISLDGFRWDYPQWYDTPFIDYMSANGVESGLIPSFPSKTFPNHYTLATGLYPEHHGIVANSFFDAHSGETFSLGNPAQKTNPKFYGGEPIWITAKKNKIKTAVFYWPGSDVRIAGEYPDTYFLYDKKPQLTLSERMNGIVNKLKLPERERPQLIMAYMEQPDKNGHLYGPHSRHTRMAVAMVDSLLGRLYEEISELPIAKGVNLIVLSDHGMAWIDATHAITLKDKVKTEWIASAEGSLPVNIYAKEGCTDSIYNALRGIDHARVWRRKDVPAYLHYNSGSRIGDVIVLPDLGYVAYDKPIKGGGQHGYDPQLSDMHALFRAIGPDFNHISEPHFRNVDVYPLLCKLLGIEPAPNDGDLTEIRQIIR